MSARFPIMLGMNYEIGQKIAEARRAGFGEIIISVPWSALTPHEDQAMRNHGQSLKTLAGRGGLSACEALAILEDRKWQRISFGAAHGALAAAIRALGAEK